MIIAGVDHSAGAREALRFALEEARLRQATLRAVHAIGASHPVLGEELVYPVARSAFDELCSAAQADLDAPVDEIASDAGGAEIERRVVEGAPASVLVEESADAELLVVDRASWAASRASCSAQSASNVRTTRPAQSRSCTSRSSRAIKLLLKCPGAGRTIERVLRVGRPQVVPRRLRLRDPLERVACGCTKHGAAALVRAGSQSRQPTRAPRSPVRLSPSRTACASHTTQHS
jgi:Universal stress protein family